MILRDFYWQFLLSKIFFFLLDPLAYFEAHKAGYLDACLFGSFSNADAMYAPVVNRFEVYELSSAAHVIAYSETMKSLPAWKDWAAASEAEPWTVVEEEV